MGNGTRSTPLFVAEHSQEVTESDRGISMIWVAVVLLFLIASAALAIDISEAFGVARSDQNTADLSCLAGVKELPSETAAINVATAYIDSNWPEMSGATLTITAPTATYVGSGGNSVYIDADYGGSGDTMYIRTTQVSDNSFGKVIGQPNTTVVQEAACSGQSVQVGTGMLPMGALPGAWNGNLFDCAENKSTGNCGALSPFGGGGSAFRDAVADGVVGNFIKHHGIQSVDDDDTGYARRDCANDPCNAAKSETGNMVGPFRQGLGDRLDTPGVNQSCPDANFNCDSLAKILGATPVLMSTEFGADAPTWWKDSLYGDYDDAASGANGNNHYYYKDESLECDSPRLASVPIVHWNGNNQPLNWDIGWGPGTLPNGKKFMKMVGFYTVYIREPDTLGEITGSNALEVDILWFGAGAKCSNGDLFQPFGSPVAVDAGVKLVAP